MKKGLLVGTVAALLLLSGCANKQTEIDANEQQTQSQSLNQSKSNNTSTQSDGESKDISTSETLNNQPLEGQQEQAQAQDTNEMKIEKAEAELKTIYFDFDKFNIRADMQAKMDSNSKELNKAMNSNFKIKIEGNCDEWGTDEYNYALGLKRAKAAKDALIDLGTNAKRIIMVSYGESNPVCKAHTQACWQQNRRAEFKLLP